MAGIKFLIYKEDNMQSQVEAPRVDPEQELGFKKKRILEKAAQLKEDFFSNIDNVIKIEDYRKVGKRGLDKNMSLNKHRLAWFQQIGALIQEMESFPEDDKLCTCLPEIIKQWLIVKNNLKLRAEQEKEVVNKEIWEDRDFKEMMSMLGLSSDDGWLLFLFMTGGDNKGAVCHLWAIKSVKDCFKDQKQEFSDWFNPLFDKWKTKLTGLREQYMKMSPESVAAGDAILEIIINALKTK